jgi:hypothetical protein
MSNIVTPIHTGLINDVDVRFFKCPKSAAELPWHAVDDLFRACLPSRHDRRVYLRSIQKDWGADLLTVATSAGPVTIAPHFAAQGLIGAMIKVRVIKPEIEAAYCKEGVKALQALMGDLPPRARFEFAMMAAKNSLGAQS